MRVEKMMFLPFWISWIGLVYARCDSLAQFGNPGQIALGPTGLFGPGCVGFGCSFTTARVGCGRSSTCLKADSIPLPLSVLQYNQPVYLRIVQNTTDTQQIDNICIIRERIPGDVKTYMTYATTVFVNGTSLTRITLETDLGGGNYLRANENLAAKSRVLGMIGDDTVVACNVLEFGDPGASRPVVASTLGTRKPLSLSVVQQIQNIFDCNGLGSCQSLYVLPYRLPSQCIGSRIPNNIILNNPGGFVGPAYPYSSFGHGLNHK